MDRLYVRGALVNKNGLKGLLGQDLAILKRLRRLVGESSHYAYILPLSTSKAISSLKGYLHILRFFKRCPKIS